MAQTRRERRGDAFQEKLARVLDARLDPIGKKLDALARTSDARLEQKPALAWHEWLVRMRAFAESACAARPSMGLLHLSSCLFATVVVHAYYCRAEAYHHAFLLLTVSSIMFHVTRGEAIRVVDKCLAHATFLLVLADAPKAASANALWLISYPLAVACLWGAQSVLPRSREHLHLWLHVISVVGMHFYLRVLY